MPELGSLGSVRGALRNERPYRECENSATLHVAPKFRGLWARGAKKIAKIRFSARPYAASHRVFARSAR